ncbi:unnamed protein product [Musa hybrid cultivar]
MQFVNQIKVVINRRSRKIGIQRLRRASSMHAESCRKPDQAPSFIYWNTTHFP